MTLSLVPDPIPVDLEPPEDRSALDAALIANRRAIKVPGISSPMEMALETMASMLERNGAKAALAAPLTPTDDAATLKTALVAVRRAAECDSLSLSAQNALRSTASLLERFA